MDPRRVFLLDGLGGLLTALMLGLVLPALQQHIGLPVPTLRLLGLVGLACAAYSLGCARFLRTGHAPWLRFIVLVNLAYGVATVVILALHSSELRPLGLAYFAAELLVILALVGLEISVLRRLPAAASA